MLSALIMMKMDSVLLVLLVTSCCGVWMTVGGDEVLHKSNNGNNGEADAGLSQPNGTTMHVVLKEANNTVLLASEDQGASKGTDGNRTQSSTPFQPLLSGTKEKTTQTNDSRGMEPKIAKSDDTSSTTARPIRNGASSVRSSASRDNKLMTLLAARRSALQRGPWRSQRHSSASNRTSQESLSAASSLSSTKNSNDPRTSCEKNCTKNFTKRTTASCIRRCLALHKVSSSATNATAAVRTKVDEKDNNEILETDESSHGFFVITKELNGTVNHIGDGAKSSESSTEKNSRSGIRPLESIEIPPYLYFGQKLPPLRPHKRGNQTIDSVAKQTLERGKSWNRNYQNRNFGSHSRFHSSRNVIRPTTTPVAVKPTHDSSKEKLGKEISEAIEGNKKHIILKSETVSPNATETILVSITTEKIVETSTEGQTEVVTNVTTATPSTSTSAMAPSTTNATTARPTTKSTVKKTSTTTSSSTSKTKTTTPTTSTTNEVLLTYQTSVKQLQLTQASVLKAPSTSSIPTTIEETHVETNPTEGTLPPPPPEELANSFDHVDEDKPNLIIFYNITTQVPTPSSPNVFTRTTISSSVRSTVNPRVGPRPKTIPDTEYNLSSRSFETTTLSNEDFDDSFRTSTDTPLVYEVTAVTMVDDNVTVEIKKVSTATYVLAGLGMLPILIIILYVVKTIIMKRRYKDDDDLDQFTSEGKPISPVRKMDHVEEDPNDQYSIVSERDFERKNLRFKSLLGEGNFGQVWKAEADDLVGHMGTTRIVAVKTVRSGGTQASLQDEADIMRKLGSHPNVVTILGACLDTEPHLLIMEYAMRGRLLSLLRAARSATNILPASVPGGRSLAPLSPRTLAGFALDIARGMEYIAEKKIVHRDLAARNVLLDHNGVCKICDFGMSIDLERTRHSPVQTKKSENLQQTQCFDTRFHFDFGGRWMSHWTSNNNNNNNNDKKHNHDSVSKRPALPIRWMAPEALQYHIFSIKTDVWAFGIVLWELATLGCTPYPTLSGREVIRNVPNGARPELTQDGRPEFYDLMQRCWRKDPQLRPSFREARIEIVRISGKWHDDDLATSDYMDVSGFSEDLEHGMVYFNRRISEFECEI